jgi:hypothetical protein
VVQLPSSAGSLQGVQTPLTQSPLVLPMVQAVSLPVQAVEVSVPPSMPPLLLPEELPLLEPLELPLLDPLELPLSAPPLELPLLLPLSVLLSVLPSSPVLASGPADDELLPPQPVVFAATAQPVRALTITHLLKEFTLCMITLPPCGVTLSDIRLARLCGRLGPGKGAQ